MLIEEFTRLDAGKEKTKIVLILDNCCCISPHYVEIKLAGKISKELEEKHCVIAMSNGMVVLVDYPYKRLLQKLTSYRSH